MCGEIFCKKLHCLQLSEMQHASCSQLTQNTEKVADGQQQQCLGFRRQTIRSEGWCTLSVTKYVKKGRVVGFPWQNLPWGLKPSPIVTQENREIAVYWTSRRCLLLIFFFVQLCVGRDWRENSEADCHINCRNGRQNRLLRCFQFLVSSVWRYPQC